MFLGSRINFLGVRRLVRNVGEGLQALRQALPWCHLHIYKVSNFKHLLSITFILRLSENKKIPKSFFFSYELMDYVKFVEYCVWISVLALDRWVSQLRKKHILSCHSIISSQVRPPQGCDQRQRDPGGASPDPWGIGFRLTGVNIWYCANIFNGITFRSGITYFPCTTANTVTSSRLLESWSRFVGILFKIFVTFFKSLTFSLF